MDSSFAAGTPAQQGQPGDEADPVLTSAAEPLAPELLEATNGDGSPALRQYLLGDMLHRDPAKGPAVEMFRADGSLVIRDYWFRGARHRDPADGPAVEWFNDDGSACKREYWVHGKRVPPPPGDTFPLPSAP